MKKVFFKVMFSFFCLILFFVSLVCTGYKYNFLNDNKSDYNIHISIDDTSEIFKDLTIHQKEYSSIFDNSTLNFCKQMHDDYGAVFSFYCFYKWKDFDLSQATSNFNNNFIECKDWIKFNYHSYDEYEDLNDTSLDIFIERYENFVKEMTRIIGYSDFDNFTRLSSFKGQKDILLFLKEHGTYGFYSADDNRPSYYLEESKCQELIENNSLVDNSITFLKTNLRLDYSFDPFKELNEICSKDNKNIEVFTHEWLFTQGPSNNSVNWKIKEICSYVFYYRANFNYNF